MRSLNIIIQSLIFLVSLTVLQFQSFAAENSTSISSFDEIVARYSEAGKFNGVLGVFEGTESIYTRAEGMANLSWDVRNTLDTKFRIASLTKQFTAALVLLSIESGEIGLDDTISDHLPYYRKDTGNQITIHHLLANSSGIPSYGDDLQFVNAVARQLNETDDFINSHCSDDLNFEPGSQFEYSNSGYYILGAILESATNESFEALLSDRILSPLDLNDTGVDWDDSILRYRAEGYDNTTGQLLPADYIDTTVAFSAGAMYSTLNDLIVWNNALNSDRLLSSASRELMFSQQSSEYGYGWFIANRKLGGSPNPIRIESHGGDIHGFSSVVVRAPESGQTIIVLNNHFPNMDTESLANELLVELNALEARPQFQLSDSELNGYQGIYAITQDSAFNVWLDGGQLFAQYTGAEIRRVYPMSENKFYYTVSDTQLTFVKSRDEEIGSLILHRGGMSDVTFPKIE